MHFWSDLIWRQDSSGTVNPLQCSKVSWLVYLLRCFDVVSARLNDKAVFFFLWNSRAYANVHTHRNLPCERTMLTEMKRSLMLEKEIIQVIHHHLKRLDLKQNVRNEKTKGKSLVGQLVRHLQIMKVHHFECQQEHLQRIFFFCCMHWQKAAISGRLHTLQHDQSESSGRDHHWN